MSTIVIIVSMIIGCMIGVVAMSLAVMSKDTNRLEAEEERALQRLGRGLH
ncbi:MAG: hypothetical protein WAU52_13625 [Burkholderiales bacterium]